eukprot:scaffold6070_cov295-Pinguiococcus_pyrenoidosus.AAC.4
MQQSLQKDLSHSFSLLSVIKVELSRSGGRCSVREGNAPRRIASPRALRKTRYELQPSYSLCERGSRRTAWLAGCAMERPRYARAPEVALRHEAAPDFLGPPSFVIRLKFSALNGDLHCSDAESALFCCMSSNLACGQWRARNVTFREKMRLAPQTTPDSSCQGHHLGLFRGLTRQAGVRTALLRGCASDLPRCPFGARAASHSARKGFDKLPQAQEYGLEGENGRCQSACEVFALTRL